MSSATVTKQLFTVPFAFGTILTISAITVLFLYTVLVVNVTKWNLTTQTPQTFSQKFPNNLLEQSSISSKQWRPFKYPAILIYRRTMKTGSSSMREALLSALQPHGYVTMPYKSHDLQTVLRHLYVRNDLSTTNSDSNDSETSVESKKHEIRKDANGTTRAILAPPRVLLVQHNSIVKSVHPERDAIIVDTIRSGYEQITSFCTHIQRVPSCMDISAMEACLKSNVTRSENFYRWAGRPAEDEDTYIDLPLSSWHPALSTTVFRTVFPNATLNLDIYNQKNFTCQLNDRLKRIYDQYYSELESQIRDLQIRLLVLAGYPTMVSKKLPASYDQTKRFTLEDMLNAAEDEERKKYPQLSRQPERVRKASQDIQDFQNGLKRWYVDSDGNLRAASKGEIAEIH